MCVISAAEEEDMRKKVGDVPAGESRLIVVVVGTKATAGRDKREKKTSLWTSDLVFRRRNAMVVGDGSKVKFERMNVLEG